MLAAITNGSPLNPSLSCFAISEFASAKSFIALRVCGPTKSSITLLTAEIASLSVFKLSLVLATISVIES